MGTTALNIETEGSSLLALVDFKWLMAGLGWRVDLTRLRCDVAYLRQCARLGLASEQPLLRKRSAELLDRYAATAHARACAA